MNNDPGYLVTLDSEEKMTALAELVAQNSLTGKRIIIGLQKVRYSS